MMELGTTGDLAPVAMWLEDYSGIRQQFERWHAEGVRDLRSWLMADLDRVAQCAQLIRVIAVNEATLQLYAARDLSHLVVNLHRIFRDEMLLSHLEELCQIWDGQPEFHSTAANYTLDGNQLVIQLKGRIFPGHEQDLARVLVVTEDVTARENARAAERQSRLAAEGLFQHSPVSLWIEDFSAIRTMLDELRDRGITDMRVFTDVHPQFVAQCMQSIRVLDVNDATLELFGADSLQTLLLRLNEVLRDDMQQHFCEQLIELWNGNLDHAREVVNYALDGSERVVIMRFSVMPGHEQRWDRELIALTDITARKKAEAYLSWLGKHDVLTGLNNRAHFIEQLNQHIRMGRGPVSVAMLDLNGLKQVNDSAGHDAGDGLLRRAGEVLREVVLGSKAQAARIGGDEFAIIMPNLTEAEAEATIETLTGLLEINNRFYGLRPLSLSVGIATLQQGETVDSMLRRADAAMYSHKRAQRLAAAT